MERERFAHSGRGGAKRKGSSLEARSEERAKTILPEPATRTFASRRWFLPSQNRTANSSNGSFRSPTTLQRITSVLPVIHPESL